jgi:undecaprenyl-diphosphatase
MRILDIMILAVIQGLAELLPVSSSAHVILTQRLMGLDPGSPEMTFLLVMLHTGTMFAVLIYFWRRWQQLLRPEGVAGGSSAFHFLGMIALATACTGALGVGLKLLIGRVILQGMLGHARGEVEELFRNLPLMAVALVTAGMLIIVAGMRGRERDRSGLTPARSLLIGAVQGLCLPFRGLSRSGATISAALLGGIRRDLAEDFSFALAVALTPPVIFLELRRLLKASATHGMTGLSLGGLLLPGFLGMIGSFLAGLVALRWLSAWLERGRWQYFGYYCVFFAGVVFLAHLYGI